MCHVLRCTTVYCVHQHRAVILTGPRTITKPSGAAVQLLQLRRCGDVRAVSRWSRKKNQERRIKSQKKQTTCCPIAYGSTLCMYTVFSCPALAIAHCPSPLASCPDDEVSRMVKLQSAALIVWLIFGSTKAAIGITGLVSRKQPQHRTNSHSFSP